MIRGLYISASSAITEAKRVDVIANNIANVNTTGYKKDVMVTQNFSEVLISRINDRIDKGLRGSRPFKPLGTISYGIHSSEIMVDFKQGQLNSTGNSFDLALRGKGFFCIDTPEGERYTRNGSFAKDAEGWLVTGEGWRVLGEDGYIRIEGNYMTVNEKGEVFSDVQLVGKLKLVDFEDYEALRKEGNGLIRIAEEIDAEPVITAGTVQQGFLEGSNVNSVKEMVEMLTMIRTYEANQRVIKIHDELIGKAVNEIARV